MSWELVSQWVSESMSDGKGTQSDAAHLKATQNKKKIYNAFVSQRHYLFKLVLLNIGELVVYV